MLVSISGLWRVGYHADPFAVSVARRGSGRFDDLRRERSVLYGFDNLETCIIEVALPWVAHRDAGYAAIVDEPADDDHAELDRADRDAAARDREIAARPRKMPADFYERARAYAGLAPADAGDRRTPHASAVRRDHGRGTVHTESPLGHLVRSLRDMLHDLERREPSLAHTR